jgi:parvulin-like peptidyl-prolyl isomerase
MRNSHRGALFALLLVALLVACGKQPAATGPTMPLPSASINPAAPSILPASVTPEAIQTALTPLATLTAPPNAVALVNGQPIPLQDFEAQVSQAVDYLKQQPSFDPESPEGSAAVAQVRQQVLSWMIDQTVVEQAAARKGVAVSDSDVEQEIARLIGDDAAKFEEWLRANGLTREGFKVQLKRELLGAALQEHIVGALPTTVEQAHARHILLPTEADAMSILLKLRSGEDFGTLARQNSQDKASSEAGGDLGFFPRGVMPVEIEAVAFALDPGQISGIVKTDFGYHIIEVVERDPARQVPDEMMATWRQQAFLRWLEAEKSVAKIRYLIPLQ